jgi:tyrosine-protein kinase Etk/Wzc
MNTIHEAPPELLTEREAESSEPTWLELLAAVGEHKWLATAVFLLIVGLGGAYTFMLPRLYTSSTLLLPPQQQQGAASAVLAQLGALAGAAPGLKSSDEMYAAFLRTQTLQNILIDRYKLVEWYGEENRTDARLTFQQLTRVSADKKTGLVTVEVDDRDPQMAATLANAHVQELAKLLARLAVTEAQQRVLFLEDQVSKGRDALAKAELAFRKAQAETGFVASQALAETGVKAGIELRSLIAAKEVALKSLSRFATPQNAEVQRLASELAALREQLLKIEQGSGPGKNSYTEGSDALSAYREVKAREAGLEFLVKQYEIAKVDEAKEGSTLQQVERASPSEKPSRPRRLPMLVMFVLVGLAAGVSSAFVRSRLKRSYAERPEVWRRLSAAWRS